MGLKEYNKKRDFSKTKEPAGKLGKKSGDHGGMFVIQKHAASHLHYDFRLEMDGVLKSWAVPKGPSLNPKDKRLAMQVEDHPVDYGDFEGIIPEGEYGGGTVMLWDRGEWEPLEGSALKQWHEGNMKFRLKGERLQGTWALIRMRGGRYGDSDRHWLLIKERDEVATEGKLVTEKFTTSVATERSMEAIATGKASKKKAGRGGMRVWKSNHDTAEDEPTGEISADPAAVKGAKKSKFPSTVKPQLATLVKSAPEGGSWVHEIKFDGYRFLGLINKEDVVLQTRNGNDWTAKFPDMADALRKLPVESAIVDGELVALDSNGVSNFQLLQNSIKGDSEALLVFYLFDLIYLNGYNIEKVTLEDRKALLKQLMQVYGKDDPVKYSEHFTESGGRVWDNACRMKLEGIISKDLTASYQEKRSKSWLKVKCASRQEFVIGGFTKPSGSRQGLGALLVGYNDPSTGELKYAGKVGTGFTDASLKELHGQLSKIAQPKSPFTNTPRGAWVRGVTWVKPQLIGEVTFTEMTEEGMLRHPSFQGLREDKKAEEVTMEKPVSTSTAEKEAKPAKAARKAPAKAAAKSNSAATKTAKAKAPKASKSSAASAEETEVQLTNPDRTLFPEEHYTKKDLADYYEAVQDRAFQWIRNRPLTLVRCPEGRSKPCFYQRHTKDTALPGIEPVDVEIKGRTETYFYLAEPIGLKALVQSSALELHGWQCQASDVEHPDRMIFDVDPSPEVDWTGVIAAAQDLKRLLEKCGFATFVMTTGGKGLHVVVPLKPAAGWDEVIQFAEAIARFLENTDPDNYTANLSKKKRTGKVFVDYLRNHKTASAVLPYSSRAREGATVATPITWKELSPKLDPRKFTIKTVPARLKRQKEDPWADYEKSRKPLNLAEVIQRLNEQK